MIRCTISSFGPSWLYSPHQPFLVHAQLVCLQQRALSSCHFLPYLAEIPKRSTYIFKCFVDSLCDAPDVVMAVFLGMLWKNNSYPRHLFDCCIHSRYFTSLKHVTLTYNKLYKICTDTSDGPLCDHHTLKYQLIIFTVNLIFCTIDSPIKKKMYPALCCVCACVTGKEEKRRWRRMHVLGCVCVGWWALPFSYRPLHRTPLSGWKCLVPEVWM